MATGDLSSVLAIFDRAAANLERLQAVWDEAGPLLPSEAQLGGNAHYENLARRWGDLLKGLPRIDGWTITEPLPDFEGIGQAFLDYREIGELPTSVWREVERPGTELDEYRHRLKQARGRAVRDRLQQLVDIVETRLPQVIDGIPRDHQNRLEDPLTQEISDAIDEIAGLMGDATPRKGRWSDLWRHIRFGEGHDWHDISEFDWPSVKQDIEMAGLTDSDPLPIDEDIDLGQLAGSRPAGTASTRLEWTQLTSGEFEQLLHDLFVRLPDYEDVQLLFRENAPDKGRDVSAIRVTKSPGVYRTERVMIQAKHWQSKSVRHTEVHQAIADVSLWPKPVVREVIIATTGSFTADAATYAENHNGDGKLPFVQLWPEPTLRTILSEYPDLIAEYRLRPA